MRYLLSDWERISNAVKDKLIYLFLDYDGTLTNIVDDPKKAFLAKETKKLLRRLSGLPGFKLSIISGRALDDIKNRVGLKGLIYFGNHGLEATGPGVRFKSSVSARHRKALKKIKSILEKALHIFKGVVVEDKGPSLSVHYRLADKKHIPFVKTVFYSITRPYEIRRDINTTTGKMTLEVIPDVKWDKGKAVLWLLKSDKKAFPIYIGDDVTDENAFKVLKNKGITVCVGKRYNTSAGFYLKNPQEVVKLLRFIWKNRKI